MLVVFAVAAVLVLAVVAWLATGRGGGLAPLPDEVPDFALPDRPIDAEDVEAVRLGVGLQGYRVRQVDALLDRVAVELRVRDARIADLEALAADRSRDPTPPLPQRPVPVDRPAVERRADERLPDERPPDERQPGERHPGERHPDERRPDDDGDGPHGPTADGRSARG